MTQITFTTIDTADLDRELREDGVERIEIIEGLYGGLMLIHASLDHGEWGLLAEWNDGESRELCLLTPAPGLN